MPSSRVEGVGWGTFGINLCVCVCVCVGGSIDPEIHCAHSGEVHALVAELHNRNNRVNRLYSYGVGMQYKLRLSKEGELF